MNLLLLALAILAAVASVKLIQEASLRRRSAQLVDASTEAEASGILLYEQEGGSRLARWLSRAGYRDPAASSMFLATTALSIVVGLTAVFLFNRFGVVDLMVRNLMVIPGGVGDALGFVAMAGPYIILLILIMTPALVVRAARRARVSAIEQDLAPSLELLATLAEAGLSFDAAIARIQESESGQRPLTREFRIYQRDVLGGIPRMESLRRLAQRIEVTSMSTFVSALIQSEQVGASLAETLRTQADELRDRRKMRALLLAQALPVKLVFPLIVCFLPGIFYSTLGPVISQFVDVMDSVLRRN
jgi:tight adherence protein C